jgi:carbamoyl-phosphate synthase large subunit
MKQNKTGSESKFGILISCIGTRVSLLNSFKESTEQLRIDASFVGTDRNTLSPALQLCDVKCILPEITGKRYLEKLLEAVRENNVKLLIPTIDTNLFILAANKEKFEKLGCRVLISSPEIINICQDKRKTYQFLKDNNFDTPETVSAEAAISETNPEFPRFLKPWDGAAAKGNTVARDREELEFHSKRIPNCLVQEFIDGKEFTCDAYVDFDMNVRCVVPRKRLEVRSGEVSKGEIVKDQKIIKEVTRLVRALKAGPGVITIQLIRRKSDGALKFIEINPRFGGGVPLSIKAGADFPTWILKEMTGEKPAIDPDCCEDGLKMLRYYGEIWVQKQD